VQQKTLYQNRNLLEQIAGFTIVAEIFRQSPDMSQFFDGNWLEDL